MNEIQERMDAWAKGGIEGESKEETKQQRNMIQIMVYQTLGKLGCSRTKMNSASSNHTESLNELNV